MKKLLGTKATDLTVGQTLQYLGLVFAFIWLPVMAIMWIAEYLSTKSWTKKIEQPTEETPQPLDYPWDTE